MEETRSTVIRSTMSLEDLDHWIGRYHLLESCNPIILGLTDSMMVPPPRKVTLNEEILWASVHLPVSRLVLQVLQNLGVEPTQLTPNS